MGKDTITLSRQATAVVTLEPAVVMQSAVGSVADAKETLRERKPPDAAGTHTVLAQPRDLKLLGDQIAELPARIDAATYELLCQLRKFNRRHGREGFRSWAHWLQLAHRP